MRLFGTVLGPGEAEQTIERSRFICYVSPAESREEAEEFFAAIRKKHKDATHNVPAMVLGDKMQIQWASDDGEPQGTSGAPMAQMLVSMGLTNVAVIVTRYFGGIKLGTGGLVRAYTSSLKLGLEAAGIGGMYEMSVLQYEMDYAAYSKLESRPQDLFRIESTQYGEKVTVELSFDPDKENDVVGILTNITNGKGEIIKLSKKFLTKPD
ncbi:MAG: YigZ family protein [Clostridiales bacterium]|nr:YigZ family protein [Clostridiales bacterium]